MQFPILVEQSNGKFMATLLGGSTLRVQAPTREAVVAQLQAEIHERIRRGELVLLDVPPTGVTSFGGIFRDDPTLDEMVTDIYRQRDAERPA